MKNQYIKVPVEKLEEIKEQVEREYNMSGLSDGLYGDYATEVANRAVKLALESLDNMPVEEDR